VAAKVRTAVILDDERYGLLQVRGGERHLGGYDRVHDATTVIGLDEGDV
jgi:hypothetical protein